MKLAFASVVLLFVAVAWGSTTSAAPALSTTTKQQYEMRQVYAGGDCSGTPISMQISIPLGGTTCRPSACGLTTDGVNSAVTTCVSGTDTELMKMAKAAFKREIILMKVIYDGDDLDCEGEPMRLYVWAVDVCIGLSKLDIRKGQLVSQTFANNECAGEPTFERPVDTSNAIGKTMGTCKSRTKTFFLFDASK